MLFDFLIYDTFYFWGALAVIGAGITYNVYRGSGVKATAVLALGILIMLLFSNLHLIHWAESLSFAQVGKVVGLYVLIGVVYMISKWFYTVYEIKTTYNEFRSAWLDQRGLKNLPTRTAEPDTIASFERALVCNCSVRIDDLPPKVGKHIDDLVFWLSYWPLSLIFTLLGNPIRQLVNLILSVIGNPLNRISAHMFKDFAELKK
jgi:hypothetical protein